MFDRTKVLTPADLGRAAGESGTSARDLLRHLLCVAALMWTGLVNGQAFFFSDTTNYIRAADIAVHLASGRTYSTAWTDRYRHSLADEQGSVRKTEAAARPVAQHNDLSGGLIMSGRSPYIGALMYLGYITSNFWAFVLLQATIAYILIVMSLKRFDLASPRNVAAVVVLLALTTSLPTYNSLLLADAFASFGIISFLLLVTAPRLSRVETIFLWLVLLMSVISHLHNLVMLVGMVLALAASRLVRAMPPVPRRAWLAGLGGVLVGVASVQATAWATELTLGKKPQLLPLLTARFIADGPGKAYIDAGCEGRRFQICRVHIGEPRSGGAILSGTTRSSGTYLLASAEQRKRMGEEDVGFAIAVFKFDPVGQSVMTLRNTIRQLLWIDYDGLNQGCFDRADCWSSLPAQVRDQLRASPSGRNMWPEGALNVILYITTIGALVIMAVLGPRLSRADPENFLVLRTWILIGGAAMLASAGFGGGVVEPQYRYQGRLVWLIPFLAAIFVLLYRRTRVGAKQRRDVAEPIRG